MLFKSQGQVDTLLDVPIMKAMAVLFLPNTKNLQSESMARRCYDRKMLQTFFTKNWFDFLQRWGGFSSFNSNRTAWTTTAKWKNDCLMLYIEKKVYANIFFNYVEQLVRINFNKYYVIIYNFFKEELCSSPLSLTEIIGFKKTLLLIFCPTIYCPVRSRDLCPCDFFARHYVLRPTCYQ